MVSNSFVRVFSAALVSAIALSGCGGGDASGPAPVVAVDVSPVSTTVVTGNTQQFTASPRDGRGNALPGRAVAWITSDATVATIDGTGLVTAIAAGSTSITASSGGQRGSASITVLPPPVASVSIAALAASPSVGSTAQLAASLLDARGNVLTGRAITWASLNTAAAVVDANGLLLALAPGVATIIATSEGQSGTVSITITPAPLAPVIASIVPAMLFSGAVATITGVGFDPALLNNTVTIGGAVARISSASATQLVVTVPCVESGNAAVRVTSRGAPSATVAQPMTVTQRTLGVGQSLILTSTPLSLCNELVTASPTARYIVTVFSGSTSANTLADFEVGGSTPALGSAQPAITLAPTVALQLLAVPGAEATRDAAHWQMLERNRADYERLMAKARRLPPSPPASRAADLPAPGDMRSLFFTLSGGCADTTRVIRGKVIYLGSKSIIWEDSANTLQSSSDATLAGYYRRLGEIFDTDQYQSVKNTFGDPLLRDGVTDGDGRVHMVFSQRLNGTGAAAYVTSCDQFTTAVSPGSNFGQFFYGSVPTVSGSNINSTSAPDGWFNFMGRTVVHEVKHIAAISARVANNAPTYEQSWLEEGTARHAEEIWVRESLHRTQWKSNIGFGTAASNGIFCDFLPADEGCMAADLLRRPSYGMRRHFNEIRDKLLQPWNWSPYGDGTGQSGSVFYQTAWSLVRYTIDRYATSDATFFRALVNATTSGTTNLAAVAGVSMDQLIGGWGLSLYADDYPGLAVPSADIQFPSWNMRSIYAGLNATPTWTSRFNTPYPVQPALFGFGAFLSRVTGLRGGAHAYFEISGATVPTQLLSIRGVGGATPSTNLRLAIARLE